jgi:outer membrane protein OmpA-like peptidoglycan-associated protein
MSSTQIETWGLGSSSPIESNITTEGRKKKRRAEFVVLYDSGE